MPRVLFKRTPTEAEGGPGHPYREGSVFDVSPRSAQRWIEMEAASPAPIERPATVQPAPPRLAAEPVKAEIDHVAFHAKFPTTPVPEKSEKAEATTVASEGDAASGGALVAIEAGGEAPPIMVDAPAPVPKPKRVMRAAAGGAMWNVFEDGKLLNRRPIDKLSATAMVATGIDAPPIPTRPGKDVLGT